MPREWQDLDSRSCRELARIGTREWQTRAAGVVEIRPNNKRPTTRAGREELKGERTMSTL